MRCRPFATGFKAHAQPHASIPPVALRPSARPGLFRPLRQHSNLDVEGQTHDLSPVEKNLYWRLRSLESAVSRKIQEIMMGDSYAARKYLKIHYAFKKIPDPKWGHLRIFVDWVAPSTPIPPLHERTFYVLPFEINAGSKEFFGRMLGATCRLCKDEIRHILVKQSDILVLTNQWRQEGTAAQSDTQRRSFYHIVGPL